MRLKSLNHWSLKPMVVMPKIDRAAPVSAVIVLCALCFGLGQIDGARLTAEKAHQMYSSCTPRTVNVSSK